MDEAASGTHGLASGRHGASLTLGRLGVLHGSASSVLQTEDGQIAEAHSVSAGLDYPGVGPELAPPHSHPVEQGVPGPVGRVPEDWERRLG